MAITLSGNATSTFSSSITSTTGHLTLGDGNLVVADGHGIEFAATSNGAGNLSSELLKDYETGLFTPTDATGNLTLETALGKYKKVGELVVVTGTVKFPVNSNNVSAKIGGLPYPPTTLGGGGSMYVIMNGNGNLAFRTENGTSNFLITDGDQQNVSITNANLTNATFQFFLVYHTD